MAEPQPIQERKKKTLALVDFKVSRSTLVYG
jgi:hypothetical protein